MIVPVTLLAGLLTGCGGCTPSDDTNSNGGQTLADVSLTISCGDPDLARSLAVRSAGWAGRTGATVKARPEPFDQVPDADIVVIRPSEMGKLAVVDQLVPVPFDFRTGVHPMQWNRIAPVYRSSLIRWGTDPVALPLEGDGFVLAYRADRFADPQHRKAYQDAHQGRSLEPPATWEDLAEIARYFTETSKSPSLPPLTKDPQRLLAIYHQIAACYDREAQAEGSRRPGDSGEGRDPATSFHIQSNTWQPRLTAPAFVAATAWFARTRADRMPDGETDDPVKALEGNAIAAVLSFEDLARLPKGPSGEVDPRIHIAPLPGTRTYFDPNGTPRPASHQGNQIPFVGFDARVAVVLKRSPNPAACWELLAEMASPTGSNAALSGTGVGPFRTEHVELERRQVWLGYGFDADRTRELAVAARRSLGIGGAPPALPLRTPHQAEVMAVLEREIRRAANGEISPEQAMQNAAAGWQKIESTHTPEELLRWRRNAAGLTDK